MTDSPPEQFRIAELAQRTGLTPRTIRYYVAEELLPPPTGSGPQRLYGPDHLLRLEAIKRLKEQYLPLVEIRRRLAGATRVDLEAIVKEVAAEPGASPFNHPTVAQPVVLPAVLPAPSRPGTTPGGFVASLGGLGAQAPGSRPGYADVLGTSGRAGRLGPPADARKPNSEDLGEQVWNRVVLAPGVELNYQLTGDRVRDDAVLRLIRNARQILGTVS